MMLNLIFAATSLEVHSTNTVGLVKSAQIPAWIQAAYTAIAVIYKVQCGSAAGAYRWPQDPPITR